MTKVTLRAVADHTELNEEHSYDVAAIRIRAVDENGNILPYFNDVIKLDVKGKAELIGPDTMALSGGMGGTYIKTIGKSGKATLKISSAYTEPVTIEFKATV